MHKYGAKRTTIDGINFDSKRESEYYCELKILQRIGEITRIEIQPKFVIIDAYPHPTTKKIVKPTYYVADFRVKYKDGREEVIDVKGFKTATYQLKKKLFESKYGIEIKEIS